MGWVKKNLCKDRQGVNGLVIRSGDPAPKLTNALEMTSNIKVKYYQVSFTLADAP